MKRKSINMAVLAAVDAGKTTLSESILFLTGAIRKAGRVDHKDAFLDTHELERSRGITIFSKMARAPLSGAELTLLDTPGHVDFTAETERTLAVADLALLVISAPDGVTGHTLELWKLLARYQLPTIIFVNKMDQEGADISKCAADLSEHLDERCVHFDIWKQDAPGPGSGAGATGGLGKSPGDGHASSLGKSPGDGQSPGLGKSPGEGQTSGSDAAGMEDLYDQIAMCDEEAMEYFLENGEISCDMIRQLVLGRRLFPFFTGSALKNEGVQRLLRAISSLADTAPLPDAFGAKCYKITRDEKGSRLTWLKITGGSLKVRSLIAGNRIRTEESGLQGEEEEADEDAVSAFENEQDTSSPPADIPEKITQIRFYSGEKFRPAEEACAGDIVAVTGLTRSFGTQTYGECPPGEDPVTESVLSYDLIWPDSIDRLQMYGKLRELSEELPEIDPELDEHSGAIHVKVMGEVQTQILQALVKERYGVEVSFGEGRIVYRETIASCAEGVGHFEPLRHYAEVHLYLEPGERGSGIVYDSDCPVDVLARHWQRLILGMLRAHRQVGVLTGSELTDIRVTLVSGRAHIKHTVGGDFRQAGRRALRQGLMKCESVLLEPYYDFTLDIPSAMIGRAMLDIGNFAGHADAPQIEGEFARLTGYAPVSTMRNYQAAVRAYTGGRGALSLRVRGYEPCHDPEEVIEQMQYDPSRDLRNPNWSVFCAHGAGYEVPWDEVDKTAHIPLRSDLQDDGMRWNYGDDDSYLQGRMPSGMAGAGGNESGETQDWQKGYETYRRHEAASQELKEIFERTYGKIERNDLGGSKERFFGGGRHGPMGLHKPRKVSAKENILLVDGYNVIHAWDDLRELAAGEMNAARTKLAELLSSYQGFRKIPVILVFDAYRVPGGSEHIERYHDVCIVYTKEAETADRYIEKAVHRMGSEFDITVATSDGAQQVIIWGAGARRMSARELGEEVMRVQRELREEYLSSQESGRNRPFAQLLNEVKDLPE